MVPVTSNQQPMAKAMGYCYLIHLFYKAKVKVKVKSLSRCLTFCDPMDGSLSDSSVHWIFQASVLEWVAISFFRGLPDPVVEPGSPAL